MLPRRDRLLDRADCGALHAGHELGGADLAELRLGIVM